MIPWDLPRRVWTPRLLGPLFLRGLCVQRGRGDTFPGCLLGSGAHPGRHSAVVSVQLPTRTWHRAHLSPPLAPIPQYSPCAADRGSKAALLLFSLKITQKANNWAVLSSPLGVFRVMYSGLSSGRDPAHFWWDLVLDSEFARVSQGWGAHPIPVCCLPGAQCWHSRACSWRGWEGASASPVGLFSLLHLSFFLFFFPPFFFLFFFFPSLSVG